MLLILSEETDITTDIVCDWLNYFSHPFKRINREKINNYNVAIHFKNDKLSVYLHNSSDVISFEKITTVWFRRGYFDLFSNSFSIDLPEITTKSICKHLANETKTLESFLYSLLKEKTAINDPGVYNYNKLIALHEAQKIGLAIPPTLISNLGALLLDFSKTHTKCITKNIQDIVPIYIDNDKTCGNRTRRVNSENILYSHYWYSLFQKEIEKKYELRIFYFLEKMYAMAIFSQSDEESDVDYREVESSYLHRMVPFNLPLDIKKKIKKLMKNLNLESGSIDMIVDKNDDFYFLEVNPVGQFHFVGQVCNYYIEKEIAQSFYYEKKRK